MAYRIEKTATGADIVIDGFEKGIADSPYQGIGDMRNSNIISVPQEASVNFKSQPIQQVAISGASFSAATSGVFTYSGTRVREGTQLSIDTLTGGTASLPGIQMVGNSSSIIAQTGSSTATARFIVSSNGLTGTSARINIGFSSQPNNGDFVILYINGTQVLMQFVTSIGATAGNVLIGSTLVDTVSNLAHLLQYPAATTATQVAFAGGSQTLINYFTSGSKIAFDAASNGYGATGLTFNSAATTATGSNVAAFVVAFVANTGGSQTATWGGVSMTLLGNIFNGWVVYYLANPGSGVKSVVVSANGGAVEAVALTYTGVSQNIVAFDNSTGVSPAAGVGDVTVSLTPNADNCFTIMALKSNGSAYTASTGSTFRATTSSGGDYVGVYDSANPIHPAASYTMVATRDGGGTGTVGYCMFSFVPVTPPNVTVGLYTTGRYWAVNTTPTTFTLSTGGPNAVGQIANLPVVIPASATGTFSTAVNLALLTQIVANADNTVYYGIDTNGRVWAYNLTYATNWIYLLNTATGASTPDFTTGIAVFQGYIMVLYDGPSGYYVYTCPVNATIPVYTSFKSLVVEATTHRTFTDKNGTLFWCDGNQVGRLFEITTFDPTSSGSYSYSASALLIQPDDLAQCMEQLGTNLIIGGIYNQNYLWDRSSNGYTPLFVPENNTHRMVTVNSNTYLFSGNRGRIYVTNGANVQLYKKVPDHLSNTIEPVYAWGGAMYNKNQLYFSITAFGSSEATETEIATYGGIWAIDTNTEAMRLVNKLSYDTYGGYTAELCGMIANAKTTSGVTVQNFGLVCGWESTTGSASPTYGSDVLPVNSVPTISNVPYDNYETYVDSDMIPIGTYLNPTTDANVEFKLTVPTVAGEGVKLAYRQNLSQSFTDITGGEFTATGTLSGVTKVNFQKSQWLQIRTYTKSTATTPSYTRVRELRIR